MEVLDVSALQLDVIQIALRLGCSMLIGAIIGVEREFSHRPAGLRTHMLVALGACAVMVTSQMLFCQYRVYGATPDPGRMGAQVIAGVGFLGAGTILREGVIVKGLTTAASVWAVACLGIAAGAGYYDVALIGAGLILITLTIVEQLQNKVFRNRYDRFTFTVECRRVATALETITDLIYKNDARLSGIHVEEIDDELCAVSYVADFAGRHSGDRYTAFIKELTENSNIVSIKSDKYEG